MGLFSTGGVAEADGTLPVMQGLFYGGGFKFLGVQALGVFSVIAYVAVIITIVFLILKHTIGLRANASDEIAGLDISEHGLLTAYAGYAMEPDTTAADCGEAITGDVPVSKAVEVEEVYHKPEHKDGDPKFTKVEIVCKEAKFEIT